MKLIVFSDLHLGGPWDPLYWKFLEVLRTSVFAGDCVVFAGDIFDLWIGGKGYFQERYDRFLKILEELKVRGVELHYIEGNHDFHLKTAFQTVIVHEKECSLTWKGGRVFCAHGDTVDQTDWGYQGLRWFLRSWGMRYWVAMVPGSWIQWLGSQMSRWSKTTRYEVLQPHLLLRKAALQRFAEGYRWVVFGHSHCLDAVQQHQCHYINMGFPRHHGSYVILQETLWQREGFPQCLTPSHLDWMKDRRPYDHDNTSFTN